MASTRVSKYLRAKDTTVTDEEIEAELKQRFRNRTQDELLQLTEQLENGDTGSYRLRRILLMVLHSKAVQGERPSIWHLVQVHFIACIRRPA